MSRTYNHEDWYRKDGCDTTVIINSWGPFHHITIWDWSAFDPYDGRVFRHVVGPLAGAIALGEELAEKVRSLRLAHGAEL